MRITLALKLPKRVKMTTEEKILCAAESEMLERGYEGARMRGIAEKAEINKGLLHYYFKSKEALLSQVFERTFKDIFQTLNDVFESNRPLYEKIELAVSAYSDFICKRPKLPFFIISEMNRNAKKHLQRMHKANAKPPFGRLVQEIEAGKISGLVRQDYNSKHFVLNMMSLVLFPLIAKPMVMFMNDLNETQFKELLQNRKQEIARALITQIKPIN